jgi:hypothetical protein
LAESDTITETLLAENPDTVALIGFLDVRDDTVVISADPRHIHSMTFPREDVVAMRSASDPEATAPATRAGAAPEQSVILIASEVMRSPIIEQEQREQLAASFLTGPIGEGAEVLMPGTLEGAAWRLGLAYSLLCQIANCSIPRRSPYC